MKMTMMIAAGVVLLASCGGEAEPDASVAPSTTTTQTTVVMTTMPSTTTTSSVATTTQGPPQRELPALLVAHDRGIDLVDSSGGVRFLDGVDVSIAYADLVGGVVYQEEQQGSWRTKWDARTNSVVMSVDAGDGPEPIMAIAGPGAEPTVLVPTGDTWVTLSQVVALDGHPTVVFRRTVFEDPGNAGCSGDPYECAWNLTFQHLILLDLVTGEERDLGWISSFESSSVVVDFSDTMLAVTTQVYGEEDPCGALYPRAMIDPPIGEGGIGEAGVLWRRCDYGPTLACTEQTCIGALSMAISPDGQTVVYAQSLNHHHLPTAVAPEFVVVDHASDEEVIRVTIGEPGVSPSWIEWDGTFAVVGRVGGDALPPVSVSIDGAVQELELMGRVTLWQAP